MPENRFYSPSLNDPIELTDQELHHMVHVMRSSINDLVEVVDGKGSYCQAKIIEIKKQKAILTPTQLEFEKPTNTPKILIQAIAQQNHLELILEKGTELGITEFWLFTAKRSPKFSSSSKTSRIERVLISALKQSGRLYLPKLTFFDSIESIKLRSPFYLADPSGTPPSSPPSTVVVGPEKGLSKEEKNWLMDQGAELLCLGKNILRCETAAIAAAVSMNFSYSP